jgi:DNA-binding MarR family transcriptional regulator
MMETKMETLDRLSSLLDTLDAEHPHISMPILRLFLAISRTERERSEFYMKQTGLNRQAMSRYASILGSRGFQSIPALGLIRAEEDALDARQKVFSLTPQGAALANKIAKAL